MSERDVLDRVEKLTDPQFYEAVKEVLAMPFVTEGGRGILRNIINQKQPEPVPVIVEEEPVVPAIEEKTVEAIAPKEESIIEVPKVEEVAPVIIEEPIVQEPAVVEQPVVEAAPVIVETTPEVIIQQPVVETKISPEQEKVNKHEREIANLKQLLELEDDEEGAEQIKGRIQFYETMLKSAKRKLESLPKEPAKEVAIVEEKKVNPNNESTKSVINAMVGLSASVGEDEEEMAAQKRRVQKKYEALSSIEKEFVDDKLKSLGVDLKLTEELKNGGSVA